MSAIRAEAVRIWPIGLRFCLVRLAACEEKKPPTEAAARTAVADEAAAPILPESEDPRCLGSLYTSGGAKCEEFRVSIVELLANPARWHDKKVVVIGFAAVGIEHSAIYIHREDIEAGIRRTVYGSGTYVLVRGRFDAKAGGHMNGFKRNDSSNESPVLGALGMRTARITTHSIRRKDARG